MAVVTLTDEGNMAMDVLNWYINDVIENADELLNNNDNDQYTIGLRHGYYQNLDMLTNRLDMLNINIDKDTLEKIERLKQALIS
ncbi:MAG: hypothetical protein E6276_09580 [Clostridiales bacterium]|nr:hypothetical protein [Peptococcus niger]MDU7245615.1 hypothetical protein [Clostridiales bacterium]